jgi:hypothetical protein
VLQREPDIIRVTVGKHKAQAPSPPVVTLEGLAQEIESLKNRLAKVEDKQAEKEGDGLPGAPGGVGAGSGALGGSGGWKEN